MARELELKTLVVAGGGERGSPEQNPEEGGEEVGHDDESECRAYNDYCATNEQNQNYHHVNMIAQNRCFVKGRGFKFIST